MRRLYTIALLCFFVAAGYAQTPSVGGVANAASGATTIAPGSLASVFGSQLASGLAQADSIPLSNQIADVKVSFNNIPAPILFVSPGQVNVQVPGAVAGGSATVVVTRNGVSSPPSNVQVGTVSPGIFASSQQGTLYGVAVNFTDNTLAWPSAIAGHPASAGGILTIYATGLGPVDSPVPDGSASSDKLRLTTTPLTVLVGGMPASVLGGAAALSPQFVGVNQINIQLPANVPLGDSVSLQLQMGGVTSTDQVKIAIK